MLGDDEEDVVEENRAEDKDRGAEERALYTRGIICKSWSAAERACGQSHAIVTVRGSCPSACSSYGFGQTRRSGYASPEIQDK